MLFDSTSKETESDNRNKKKIMLKIFIKYKKMYERKLYLIYLNIFEIFNKHHKKNKKISELNFCHKNI